MFVGFLDNFGLDFSVKVLDFSVKVFGFPGDFFGFICDFFCGSRSLAFSLCVCDIILPSRLGTLSNKDAGGTNIMRFMGGGWLQ